VVDSWEKNHYFIKRNQIISEQFLKSTTDTNSNINSQCQQGYSIGSYSPQSRHVEGQDAIVGHSKEKNEEPGNELEGVPGTAPAVMAWARDLMHHGGVMVRTRGALVL